MSASFILRSPPMHPRARTRACNRTRTHLAARREPVSPYLFLSGRARVKCVRRVIAQLFLRGSLTIVVIKRKGWKEKEKGRNYYISSICESTQSVLLPSVYINRSNGQIASSFFNLFPLQALLLATEQGRKWRIRANGNDKRQWEHGRGGEVEWD